MKLRSTIPLLLLAGCRLYSHPNKEWTDRREPPRCACGRSPLLEPERHASFDIRKPRGNPQVLVLLSLSGGGSRAAYFSASAMFRLQRALEEFDLLKEVDLISSISGGSLAACYYCVSSDPGPAAGGCNHYPPFRNDVVWDEARVKEVLARDFTLRWVGRWFLPHNIVRYWFTSFDRTDIMAQTFAANLFGFFPTRRALRFRDLNPERPYLILNATDGTESTDTEEHFGNVFPFTVETFREKLNSDLSRLRLANAVMASAAFPAVFNHVTLRDFRDKEGKPRYLHLFDGGNSDNLGLESIEDVLEMQKERYCHFVVILVDSYVKPRGIDRNRHDARGPFGYIVDLNFMDTFDSLLTIQRRNRIDLYKRYFEERGVIFLHLTFSDVEPSVADPVTPGPLRDRLQRIPTSLSLSRKDARRIDRAVEHLLGENRACRERLGEIRRALSVPHPEGKLCQEGLAPPARESPRQQKPIGERS